MKKIKSKQARKKATTPRAHPSTPPAKGGRGGFLRRWGLATRLEHRRVKGKNRKRPGKEK